MLDPSLLEQHQILGLDFPQIIWMTQNFEWKKWQKK